MNLDAFNDTGHSTFHHNNNHNTTTTDDVGDDDDDDKNNIWSLQMRHVDPPIFTIDNFLTSMNVIISPH